MIKIKINIIIARDLVPAIIFDNDFSHTIPNVICANL